MVDEDSEVAFWNLVDRDDGAAAYAFLTDKTNAKFLKHLRDDPGKLEKGLATSPQEAEQWHDMDFRMSVIKRDGMGHLAMEGALGYRDEIRLRAMAALLANKVYLPVYHLFPIALAVFGRLQTDHALPQQIVLEAAAFLVAWAKLDVRVLEVVMAAAVAKQAFNVIAGLDKSWATAGPWFVRDVRDPCCPSVLHVAACIPVEDIRKKLMAKFLQSCTSEYAFMPSWHMYRVFRDKTGVGCALDALVAVGDADGVRMFLGAFDRDKSETHAEIIINILKHRVGLDASVNDEAVVVLAAHLDRHNFTRTRPFLHRVLEAARRVPRLPESITVCQLGGETIVVAEQAARFTAGKFLDKNVSVNDLMKGEKMARDVEAVFTDAVCRHQRQLDLARTNVARDAQLAAAELTILRLTQDNIEKERLLRDAEDAMMVASQVMHLPAPPSGFVALPTNRQTPVAIPISIPINSALPKPVAYENPNVESFSSRQLRHEKETEEEEEEDGALHDTDVDVDIEVEEVDGGMLKPVVAPDDLKSALDDGKEPIEERQSSDPSAASQQTTDLLSLGHVSSSQPNVSKGRRGRNGAKHHDDIICDLEEKEITLTKKKKKRGRTPRGVSSFSPIVDWHPVVFTA